MHSLKKYKMTEIVQTDLKELNEKINKESAIIDMLMLELNKVIVGQKAHERTPFSCFTF